MLDLIPVPLAVIGAVAFAWIVANASLRGSYMQLLGDTAGAVAIGVIFYGLFTLTGG